MPNRPSPPCTSLHCPNLQPCPIHARKPFASARRSADSIDPRLYNSTEWKKASKAFLAGKACIDCGAPATVTDHDPPHRGNPALFWDTHTWHPRCYPCHQRKTGQETRSRIPSRRRPPEAHPGIAKTGASQ